MNQTHHQQAFPQMASKNDYHEPQQNLLAQQNSPALDMVLLYLQGHILEHGLHTFVVPASQRRSVDSNGSEKS